MARPTKRTVQPIREPEVEVANTRVVVTLKEGYSKNHRVYLATGLLEFVDGKANVTKEVADELKELGVI